MPVGKETQELLSRWCVERVPAHARSRLQVAYTIHNDQVTIVERHPPTFPELSSEWSTTRVAQLRHDDPEPGLWQIYALRDGSWRRYQRPPSASPAELLDEIAADPSSVFWG